MDTPTSAAPDEKTPLPEAALATQIRKEKSNPSRTLEISAEQFNSSVARLTSNSIAELHQLVSELEKMQQFLKSEVVSVQRQIVGSKSEVKSTIRQSNSPRRGSRLCGRPFEVTRWLVELGPKAKEN